MGELERRREICLSRWGTMAGNFPANVYSPRLPISDGDDERNHLGAFAKGDDPRSNGFSFPVRFMRSGFVIRSDAGTAGTVASQHHSNHRAYPAHSCAKRSLAIGGRA